MGETMEASTARGRAWTWMRVAALVLGLVLIAAACGNDDDDAGDGDGDGGAGGLLEQAQEEGITVGFANEVPYGFEGEDGEPTGEAPEVAREVLSRMGIDEMDGVVVDFGALINGLNAGQFDMVAAGMFITEERAESALFTDPDYCGTQAFGVVEGNPLGVTDFDSIAANPDVQLGVLSGAVEDGYATDSGVPEDQINRFDTTPDLVDALTAGRIDAFGLTAVTVREQVEDLDGYEATESFIPVIDGEEQLGCGGYVFSFDNKDFRDEFNDVLVEMRENDEILPIVEEFGFTAAETDAAKGVTVEDLIGMPYDFGITG